MNENYKLLYPLPDDSIFQPEGGWLILLAILYLIVFVKFKKRTHFIGFIFIFITALLFNFYPYFKINHLISSNKALIIEGKVEKLIPINKEGKGYESFCIKTQCFFYSNYSISGGFNKTQLNGSPIKNGMFLRVTYQFTDASNTIILKIEQKSIVN
jgi:hypothetical protein